jgi:hypothetical protein
MDDANESLSDATRAQGAVDAAIRALGTQA